MTTQPPGRDPQGPYDRDAASYPQQAAPYDEEAASYPQQAAPYDQEAAEGGSDPTQQPRETEASAATTDSAPSTSEPPLRTRAGLAWVIVCIAALLFVLLIIFIAQNTQDVHVSFLWLDGTTSLAVTSLVAAAVGALVVIVLGTARIIQLRRAVKKG